jgi:hypothetical protein
MINLDIPRSAETADILRFKAKFKELRKVTNATTTVATRQKKAIPKIEKGNQGSSAVTTPVIKGSASLEEVASTMEGRPTPGLNYTPAP